MNLQSHLNGINKTINSLLQFQERTKSPNPIPHQYIGTMIDNTVCLLCSAGNSLDNGNRLIKFSDQRNWISLIKTIHRSFFSSVHTALECGIIEECVYRNITVESSEKKRYVKILENLDSDDPNVKKLRAYFEKRKPSFKDYLNKILVSSKMNNERRKIWISLIDGLSIIRNKASHSDPSLSEHEREILQNGGFAVMISQSGELHMNPQYYPQTVQFILDFWDELYSLLEDIKPE